MIEYTDDKFGIIKVLNVTEARAHFATVLGDNHSHYVITKNNKPMRVIIGYGDYEKLKQQLGPEFVSSIQEVGQNFSGSHTEAALAEVAHKQKKAKSRVPGILESNIALSYSVPDKREKRASVQETERHAAPQQTQNAVFAAAPQKQAPVFSEPVSDDYFSSASIESFDESDLLSHPDEVHRTPTEIESAQQAPASNSMSGDQAQAIHDALQQAIAATTATQKASSAPSTKKEIVEKTTVVEKPKEPASQVKKDPEQDDYFRKYKKLYERFETPQAPQEQTEEAADVKNPSQAVFDDQGLENELEAFSEASEPAPAVASTSNTYFSQPEKSAAPAQAPRPSKQASPAPAETPRQKAGQGHEPLSGSRQGASSELPSLKDLLASLDEEKLSGEDEEVDESEIENLIQRIQED